MPLHTTLTVFILFAATAVAQPPEPAARLDRHGDPLPPGAIARLGTMRLRYTFGAPGLEFLSDGKALVTGRKGEGFRLWDVAAGKLLARLNVPLVSERIAVAPDGRWVAGVRQNSIILWEPRTGKETTIPLGGEAAHVTALAFAPDSGRLAIALSGPGNDAAGVRVLEVPTGRVRFRIATDKPPAQQLAFSADGRTLVAIDWGHTAYHRDADSGALRHSVALPRNENTSSDFLSHISADGRWLFLIEPRSGKPMVVDTTTGERRCELDWQPGKIVKADFRAHFAPDGKALAVLVNDSDILARFREPNPTALLGIWDPATGKRLGQMTVSAMVGGVRLAPDGRTVAVLGPSHSSVQIWDVVTGRRHPLPEGHEGSVRPVVVAPDANCAVSSDGHEIRCWELADGRPRWTVADGYSVGLGMPPDGRSVIAAYQNGAIKVLDLATGRVTRTVAEAQKPDGTYVAQMALTANGETAILVMTNPNGHQTTLQFHDLGPKPQLSRLVEVGKLPWGIVAPDGRSYVGTRQDNYKAVIHDLATGRERPLFSEERVASADAFAPDGRTIVGSFDKYPKSDGPFIGGTQLSTELRLTEVLSGRILWSVPGPAAPPGSYFLRMEFAPDGRTIAAGTDAGALIVVDAATGRERFRIDRLDSPVCSLAFTTDGSRLVTGHYDSTILVWDVATATRREPAPGATDAQLDSWWTALAGDDAPKAYSAVWGLAGVPDQAVPLVKSRLKPGDVPVERIRQLLADLDSPRFAVREAAVRDLTGLGELAEPALRHALTAGPTLEQRPLIQALLERVGEARSPESRQTVRGVWALERAGTPEAVRALEALAGGAPELRLTQEARNALSRLRRGTP
jgi:WD40 repeat protein